MKSAKLFGNAKIISIILLLKGGVSKVGDKWTVLTDSDIIWQNNFDLHVSAQQGADFYERVGNN